MLKIFKFSKIKKKWVVGMLVLKGLKIKTNVYCASQWDSIACDAMSTLTYQYMTRGNQSQGNRFWRRFRLVQMRERSKLIWIFRDHGIDLESKSALRKTNVLWNQWTRSTFLYSMYVLLCSVKCHILRFGCWKKAL